MDPTILPKRKKKKKKQRKKKAMKQCKGLNKPSYCSFTVVHWHFLYILGLVACARHVLPLKQENWDKRFFFLKYEIMYLNLV